MTATKLNHKARRKERALRLARDYWLQTIWPYIRDRKLHPAAPEFEIAQDAYNRLYRAHKDALRWNRSSQAQRFPIRSDAFPDMTALRFAEPEPLCKDENLTPQALAQIAGPSSEAITDADKMSEAHHRLSAASKYIENLPDKPAFADSFAHAFREVSASEILDSLNDVKTLPLLALGNSAVLSEIIKAIQQFIEPRLRDAHLFVAKAEYQRQLESDARLKKAGAFMPHFGPPDNPPSYHVWRRHQKARYKADKSGDTISVFDLCQLRWNGFEQLWQKRNGNVKLAQLIDEEPKPLNDVGTLGRLKYANDFQDIWLDGKPYDLRRRQAARLCIRFLIEKKAEAEASAQHFSQEIEPYVRQKAALECNPKRRIQDFFSGKHYRKLCRDLIAVTGRCGRYFLKV